MIDDPIAEKLPRTWLLLLTLVCVALAPQAVAVTGGWIFDDTRLIASNPYVHGLEHWQHWFTSEFWDISPEESVPSHATFWRPLVTASYAWDWTLGNGSPVLFHITNLLLHGVATALTFVVLRRWLKTTTAVFLATMLLSVHPFRTESVAWIAGRPDPMVTVAVLLTLQGIALRLRGRTWGVALEMFGTVIAYLSKEHAIVLPVFAMMEAYVAVGRFRWSPLLKTVVPQAFVAFGYLLVRWLVLPFNRGGGPSWPLHVHLGVIAESVGRYVAMLLWPHDLTFGSSLMRLDAAGPQLQTPYLVVGTVAVLSVVLLGIWSLRRHQGIALGLLLTAAALAPVSNVMSTGYSVLVSQRFLYLPALPLAFLLGAGVQRFIAASPAPRRALLAVVGGVSATWIVLTLSRSMDYQSEDRFWYAEAESTPDYYPALVHYTDDALDENRPRLALGLAHVSFEAVKGTAAEGFGPRMIARAVEAALRLTPDLDQRGLDELYRFLLDARSGRDASLSLAAFQLQLSLPAGSDTTASFLEEPVVDQLLLECAMRTGRWQQHRALARRVVETKPSRATTIARQAAAAHDFELARWALGQAGHDTNSLKHDISVLEAYEANPNRVPPPLVASAYVRCQAWGKAYQVVQPFLQPSAALDVAAAEAVAEVAYCAGDETNAKRLLTQRFEPRAVERLLAAWRLKMQWVDAPRRPDELPLPDALARRL